MTSPDDTQEEVPFAEPSPERRRQSSGPRRKISLTGDAVRDAIEARYQEEGQWDALVELYLSRMEVAPTEPEKAELLKRVADVFLRELDDPGQAYDALLEALALDPRDRDTSLALEEAARRSGRVTTLVKALKARLDAGEKDQQRELRYAEILTRVYREDLDDAAAAEPFLARVRRIDPSNLLVFQRMASMYRDAGEWDAQRDALTRGLLHAHTVADRRSLHLALAELFETGARDVARAREHYEAALAVDATAMDALHGLERLARMSDDFTRLAEILDRQVDATTDDDERVAALMRLADVHERQFVKPQNAAPKFELALVFDPTHTGAHDGLERAYRAMRAWPDLVQALERRARLTVNPLEKTDCLMKAGAVHEGKLSDPDAAIETYRRVFAIDDGHVQALGDLARLSEKKKDWAAAAAYRARLADLALDAKGKAQIHAQVAEMLAAEDRDPTCARLHFEKAVTFDPGCLVAWEGLQRFATRSGDGMYTVHCLEKRAEHTDSPRLKAQLLVELAKLKAELGDSRGAMATYEYAIRTDGTNEAAARAVLEPYVRGERWQDASPVCDLLLNAATRDGQTERAYDLLRLAARIAGTLGNEERALAASLAALEMRPTDPRVVADVIDACHRRRADADVRARTRATLARVVELTGELGATSIVKLADVLYEDGAEELAVQLLCQALALDAEHAGALQSLAALFFARGDWKRACGCKTRLAHASQAPDEKFALLVDAADIWEKSAKNRAKAVHILEEALALRPGDLTLLGRLVTLYGELSQWDNVMVALRTIADAEDDAARKAKSIYAMAQVARDKLGDARRAVQLFEEALDFDETRLDAFERVVRIHTEARDWEALRVAYCKMIGRAHDSSDRTLKHALYHQLGLVYRDRLGDAARALDAFRCASRLEPENESDRKIVLELLVVMDQLDVAVSTARAALRREPENATIYRELVDLFLRQRTADRAWCALDVLAHLGAERTRAGGAGELVDEEQRRFLADYPPCKVSEVPGTLAGSAWSSHLLHPDMDGRLTAIFRIVAPAILRMRLAAVPERERARWLGRPIRAEDSEAARRFVAVVHDTAEVLAVPTPVLYDRPAMPLPMAVAPAPGAALFVSLDAVDNIPQDLLPYLVARRLAELRPELAAHALFPTVSELKSLLKAAMRAAVAGPNGDGAKPEERALARALEPKELEAMRGAVSSIIDTAAKADIRRWVQLADVSLARAGLLMVGDVDTAWRAAQREARSPGDISSADWRKELLTFAVSNEYAELRGAIGVSLDAPSG